MEQPFDIIFAGEILEFLDKKKYKKLPVANGDILYYSGRILSRQKFRGDVNLSEAALDLTASTVCVPLSDVHSLIARTTANEIDWYHFDVMHGGVESALRYAQRVCYIIGGRDLVKRIKQECHRCKILEKKAVKLAMGPTQDANLNIAPVFHTLPVDIYL